MARQLNVRSDEAYDIAHGVADQTGRPVTEIVLEALREYGTKFPDRSDLTPTQRAEIAAIRAITRRAAKKRLPGVTFEEIMNSMYDEDGLPI